MNINNNKGTELTLVRSLTLDSSMMALMLEQWQVKLLLGEN